VQRRFRAEEPLSLARDFVLVAAAETGAPLAADGFDVSSSFPKRLFGPADARTSLRELKLAPQAVLFVVTR
jgi:hypothetical protein